MRDTLQNTLQHTLQHTATHACRPRECKSCDSSVCIFMSGPLPYDSLSESWRLRDTNLHESCESCCSVLQCVAVCCSVCCSVFCSVWHFHVTLYDSSWLFHMTLPCDSSIWLLDVTLPYDSSTRLFMTFPHDSSWPMWLFHMTLHESSIWLFMTLTYWPCDCKS